MTDHHPVLAVFDFDHTLIRDDSFWSYLRYTTGNLTTLVAVMYSLFALVQKRLASHSIVDSRTFIKDQLLHRLLAKKRVDTLVPGAHKLRLNLRWNEPILKALLEHNRLGHQIVIASGGLDLYLPHLLKDVPHHAILCTEVGVNNGIVTGEMTQGNCVRLRKAERVSDYIKNHGPFRETWGYGNLPHDLPMLNLLQHRLIV